MPRFRIKSLMILVAIVALWLSTITGYRGAEDVRAFIMLSILVMSGVAAISYEGPRRAFLIGFFIAVVAMSLNVSPNFRLIWVTDLLNAFGQSKNLFSAAPNPKYDFSNATIHALVRLLLATVAGFIGILIYGHSQRTKD